MFGSSRFDDDPSDIDMLFVYDQSKIAPTEAYARFRPIFTEVERLTGISVHAVVITEEEERKTEFMANVKPFELTAQYGK